MRLRLRGALPGAALALVLLAAVATAVGLVVVGGALIEAGMTPEPADAARPGAGGPAR